MAIWIIKTRRASNSWMLSAKLISEIMLESQLSEPIDHDLIQIGECGTELRNLPTMFKRFSTINKAWTNWTLIATRLHMVFSKIFAAIAVLSRLIKDMEERIIYRTQTRRWSIPALLTTKLIITRLMDFRSIYSPLQAKMAASITAMIFCKVSLSIRKIN